MQRLGAVHVIQMQSDICGFCDAPPVTAVGYHIRVEGRPVQGRFPACARCAALRWWLAVGAAVVGGLLLVCGGIAITDLAFADVVLDFGEDTLPMQTVATWVLQGDVALGLACAVMLRVFRHVRFDRRARERLRLVSVSIQAIAGHVGRLA